MADGPDREERTEEPSQRRLDQAAERGDVAKSQEMPVFFALGALTLALMVASEWSARTLSTNLRFFLASPHLVPDDGAAFLASGRHALATALRVLSVPVGIVVIAALGAGLLQHKPVWSFEPLKPTWSRLSPASGLTRIMGREALLNFGKGLLKIVVVGVVTAVALWGERERVDALVSLQVAELVQFMAGVALRMLGLALAIYAVLALGDFVLTRFKWLKRQRMTKQEVKEEHKDQEGNPEIKARLRQIRVQRLRKRMMAAVPSATVVIANPTHYAVALRYEKGQAAPICVAKGVDELALRIRSVAAEHNVPVVENPPLARALHATVQVDDEIPVEHYKAVAEVIGFVLRLKRRAS